MSKKMSEGKEFKIGSFIGIMALFIMMMVSISGFLIWLILYDIVLIFVGLLIYKSGKMKMFFSYCLFVIPGFIFHGSCFGGVNF